jgi:hypothetical protein
MHVTDRTLIMDTGETIGPFSSHWAAVAAVAAMIRLDDPGFRSLGGDRPDDLVIEKAAWKSASII